MGVVIKGFTPEEIKESLKICAEGGDYDDCKNRCPFFRGCAHGKAAAAEYIERLEVAQPKWISVKERLPEDNVDVLVHGVGRGNGCKVVAMTSYTHHMHGYDIEGWRSPWDYFHCEYEITHWMTLPESPKEEEHDS